jgi:putative Holliday junction resolvase
MGIDFGFKRIGLALSDDDEQFAMPLGVVDSSQKSLEVVVREAEKNNVIAFVMGESKNYDGKENRIMERIHVFVDELKKASGKEVYLEPEFMTSAHAEKLQGKHDMIDASSAALILQSFLDKKRNGGL